MLTDTHFFPSYIGAITVHSQAPKEMNRVTYLAFQTHSELHAAKCVTRRVFVVSVEDIKLSPICYVSSGFIAYSLVVIQRQRGSAMKNSDRRYTAFSSSFRSHKITHTGR